MASNNFEVFMPILILMVMALGIVVISSLASRFIRPSKPSELKATPYECGEEPIGTAWSAFNVRFYVVGLIFIIFDVESVLMFPVAAVFKKFNEIGRGGLVLVEILVFVLILAVGLAYCWRKGDLDWVKTYRESNTPKGH